MWKKLNHAVFLVAVAWLIKIVGQGMFGYYKDARDYYLHKHDIPPL